MRQSLAARAAPGRPEIDENHFSMQVVERNVLPIDGGDGKRRRHSRPREFGLNYETECALALGIIFGPHFCELLEARLGGPILIEVRECDAIVVIAVRELFIGCHSLGEFLVGAGEQLLFLLFDCFFEQHAAKLIMRNRDRAVALGLAE